MFMLLLLVGVYSQAIYDIFGDQGRVANAVAWAESSMNPNAQNWVYPDASIGLFQINLNAHAGRVPGATWSEKVAWLENPYNNIGLAHQLYLESGWSIWGGWSSGAYWKY
jgi:hypothetical protein